MSVVIHQSFNSWPCYFFQYGSDEIANSAKFYIFAWTNWVEKTFTILLDTISCSKKLPKWCPKVTEIRSEKSYSNCCVFRPALGCCVHPKAGRNIFFSHFQPFLFISKLFHWKKCFDQLLGALSTQKLV